MIDFIASIVWWKWFASILVLYLIYGVFIRAYAEYKMPVLRDGKWADEYFYKMYLIKQRDTFIYVLFRLEPAIASLMIIIPLISLLKND